MQESGSEPISTAQRPCFLITPIGEENTPLRRETDEIIDRVVEPLIRQRGYTICVSHRMFTPTSIPDEIWKHLVDDPLVIANLTHLNSNVMYELGIRDAIRKPVVLIAANGTPLPFDIRHKRVIFYDNNMTNHRKFRRDLRRAVDAAGESDSTALSPDPRAVSSGPQSIRWDRVGSLFWFPSEMRKLRLFFEPESPTQDRMVDGLVQALHHATRLGCNKFVIREIDRALKDIRQTGFRELDPHLRKHHADRLRVAMDTLAVLAEATDPDFDPGPRAAHPAPADGTPPVTTSKSSRKRRPRRR